MQLGIVAQGLEGLTGSTADEGEENLDSMVGMASSMLGVKLRPLTFFRGYSNMMSLIWSGGSGDPAGVEAMLLLSDHMQVGQVIYALLWQRRSPTALATCSSLEASNDKSWSE